MEQAELPSPIETEKPRHNEVVVDFLRHGQSSYTGVEPDLTERGIQQIEQAAEPIVESIDSKRDIVVFWSSPAARAQGSESVIRQKLEERGVTIYKDRPIPSMRSFDQRDSEEMDRVWQELGKVTRQEMEVRYAKDRLIEPGDPKYERRREIFEGPEEVRRRAERVVNWIRYLAEHADTQGKRLRIIGASHAEFLDPILEDLFDYDVEQQGAVGQGEVVRLNFDYDSSRPGQPTQISAQFRGQKKEEITFDAKTRKFTTY